MSILATFLQNFQIYSSAVQALASVILIIVTAVYVYLTYEILHSPYKAFLVVTSVTSAKSGNKGWIVKIKNFGPGLAKNLKIKNVVQTIIGFDTMKEGQVYLKNEFSLASGSFFLRPNEEGEYCFEKCFLSFDTPFYLTWQTITEKGQKSAWLKRDNTSENYVPLNFTERIKWKFRWYKIVLLSPYHKLKRWRNSKIATKLKSDKMQNLP
jgi:hypothetical protein